MAQAPNQPPAPPTAPPTAAPPHGGGATTAATWRRAVWPLAIAETLVWAGFYYLFPALLAQWEADLGWSKPELAGAFTGALVVTALAAPLAGRAIDRGHGGLLLTGASLCGGLLLLLLSQVTEQWQFVAIWLFLGLCMAGCLYEPCFAFLTRYFGAGAKRPITLITLVAGLAGTVSFPSLHALAEALGWRDGVFIFGVVICLVSAPLFWRATLALRTGAAGGAATPQARTMGATNSSGRARAVMRTAPFWLLALAAGTISLNHGMLMTHMLPMLQERGLHLETAVLAASMIGPMQVAGRLGMMAMERMVAMTVIGALALAGMALASGALLVAGTVPILVVAFVVMQGSCYGVTSITRPVIAATLLGREDFGAISGALAVPFMGALAVSPILAAGIWELGGYGLVITVCLGSAMVGCVAILLAIKLAAPPAEEPD